MLELTGGQRASVLSLVVPVFEDVVDELLHVNFSWSVNFSLANISPNPTLIV
jgi:hypothetical protein